MKARFLRAAQEDLREAVRYYEAQRPGLGAEFREEVRSTVERVYHDEPFDVACDLAGQRLTWLSTAAGTTRS